MTKEAEDLIEKDVAIQTKDKKNGQEMPVEFTVKETLCDSDSVHIVLEVQAKDKEKYLLVPENSKKSENVSGLGIKEEKTIGEYADSKGLKLLYINHGFDDSSEFSPLSYSFDHVLVNDDTMNIYISARKESSNKKLNVAVECSVRGTPGTKGTLCSTLNFKLRDRSSGKKVSYTSDGKMAVKGTKAVVTKVTMERTEVNTYVKVYYSNPDKDLESGLFFRIRDEKGTLWDWSDAESGDLGSGKYCCTLTYDSAEFPEKCILEAFDCWETNDIFGQFTITKE